MDFERMLYDMFSYNALIILCVLDDNLTHWANVLNITLEGMLLMEVFTSVLFMMLTKNIFLGILGNIIIPFLSGLIFNFVGVTKRGNPIITGLIVNLIAPSVNAFILRTVSLPNLNVNSTVDVAALEVHIPITQSTPFLDKIPSGHPFLVYLSSPDIFIMWMIMYRTKFGVHACVASESEEAAVSVGIRTSRIKYVAILIDTVCYALARANMVLGEMVSFAGDISTGVNFTTITAIFYGRGQSIRASLYATLFDLTQALVISLNISAGPASGLLNTLPYFIVTTISAITSTMQLRSSYVCRFRAEWSPQPVKKTKLGVKQYGEDRDSDREHGI